MRIVSKSKATDDKELTEHIFRQKVRTADLKFKCMCCDHAKR